MRIRWIATLRCILTCLLFILAHSTSYAFAQVFDLPKIGVVQDQSPHITPEERIALGIEYLKEELATPSHCSWGMAGGPIDSGYVQSVIVGSLAFPAAEDPAALRRLRHEVTDKRVKDLLAIPLSTVGERDMIPIVLRLARTDEQGGVRQSAILALHNFFTPPLPTDVPARVLAPHPWKPLDAKTSKAITEVFVAALQDPFKRYYGQKKNERYAYYPVQEQATRGLQHMGLRVVPRATQTTIENENGQILKTLPFKLKQGAKFRP